MADSGTNDLPPGMRINQYGHLEPFNLHPEDWEKRWERNTIGFHANTVSEILQRNIDSLLEGRKNIKILLPLCGKSMDIKWLYDQGHTVVGIECAELAIKAFFKEHRLEYYAEELTTCPGKVYQNTDGRIRLYMMDLFNFTDEHEGLFDGIWDKSAFVAINKIDRKKYCDTLSPLMSQDCCYLLDTVLYDPEKYTGPPHDVSRQDVDNLFGSGCSITELESLDALTEKFKNWGCDWRTETLYLIKPKKS